MRASLLLALAGLGAAVPFQALDVSDRNNIQRRAASAVLTEPTVSTNNLLMANTHDSLRAAYQDWVSVFKHQKPQEDNQTGNVTNTVQPRAEPVQVPLTGINALAPETAGCDCSDDEGHGLGLDLDVNLHWFETVPHFSHIAHEQHAPHLYDRIFSDHNATAIHESIEARILTNYDAHECSQHCNNHGACLSFGIFIERQPSCTNCLNPHVKIANVCELYNTHLAHAVITDGRRRHWFYGKHFTRAVRGSNGYNKRSGKHATTAISTPASASASPSPAASASATTPLTDRETVTHTVTTTQPLPATETHTVSVSCSKDYAPPPPAANTATTITTTAPPTTVTVPSTPYNTYAAPPIVVTQTHTETTTVFSGNGYTAPPVASTHTLTLTVTTTALQTTTRTHTMTFWPAPTRHGSDSDSDSDSD